MKTSPNQTKVGISARSGIAALLLIGAAARYFYRRDRRLPNENRVGISARPSITALMFTRAVAKYFHRRMRDRLHHFMG